MTNTDDLKTAKRSFYFFPFDILRPDPENIRKERMGDIDALARSIMERGLDQPLIVRRGEGATYIVTDGHRRLAACGLVKTRYEQPMESIPCLLEERGTTEVERLFIMLNAGTHGLPLTALEEGMAYKKALESFGVKESVLAQKTGRTVSYVRGCLHIASNASARDLSPFAASKLAGLPKGQAERVLESGAHTAKEIDANAKGKYVPPGKVEVRRTYEYMAVPGRILSEYQRGYLRALGYVQGREPALELEEE